METYYVDGKNGNDNSGNGKSNNPWKTLGKAYNQMDAGDTVRIRSATYREDLALNKDSGNAAIGLGQVHDDDLDLLPSRQTLQIAP